MGVLFPYLNIMVYMSEVHHPKLWSKPISKVYDVNRVSGEFLYKPMVDYVDWKQNSGVDFHHPKDLLERKKVDLPSPLEMYNADIACLSSGSPRLVAFLAQYGAKQIKEINTEKAHIKHAFARKSKNSETIPQKQNSVLTRDQYIARVSTMYKDQLKMEKDREEEEERKEFAANNKHGYLRYAFNLHAPVGRW